MMNPKPIKRIPAYTKLNMALDALKETQSITTISKQYGCSRTSVHQQKNILINSVSKAFQPENNEMLFSLPVTKQFMLQMVLALHLICKASYRDIQFFLQTMFNYSLSLGSVFNIIDEASDTAVAINQSYRLEGIKESAADEIFHGGKPILTTVDIPSRFCALLVNAELRDEDTWGIHLLDLAKQGYHPDLAILDGAKGLTAGHQVALPSTKLQYDHFHIIKDIKECERFLKNEEASAVTMTLKLYKQSHKNNNDEKRKIVLDSLQTALAQLSMIEEVHRRFKLLAQWLQYDVLQLAGYSPQNRAIMYDFVVTEMEKLIITHPHRIQEIVTSLHTQRDALLDVANTLNNKFNEIAKYFNLSLATIWQICYLARYDIDSVKYNRKSSELEELIGAIYDDVEDAVLFTLETTHRCSSMVENFHSRLKPYLDERKMVTQKHLGLIQFYLNHKPFMRSQHKAFINKTPAEILTGKAHNSWLEMLGFPAWYNQKAA
jgi:hypothetical protein